MSRRAWVAAGARCGLVLSAGVALSRWLSAEPYSPLFMPYDVGLFVRSPGLTPEQIRRLRALGYVD